MQLDERVLQNEFVRLEPLDERHREPLRTAADADQETWRRYYLYSLAGEHFDVFWARVQADRAAASWIPFAVLRDGRVVGISCYIGIEAAHNALEIGNTWYIPDVRGSAVNPATKHLLLGHAFESGANRVQFRVDATNLQSQAALLKLGATAEGTFRQERVTWTGRVRDTMFFSILRQEWPGIDKRLRARLADLGAQ